jgi:hypothetical protein
MFLYKFVVLGYMHSGPDPNRVDCHNLSVLLNPKHTLHDIECGLHSGFRWCDVLFFVTGWWALRLYDSFFQTNHRTVVKYHELVKKNYPGSADAEYICCPVCVLLKRKPVKLKKCKCLEKFKAQNALNEKARQERVEKMRVEAFIQRTRLRKQKSSEVQGGSAS